MELDSLIDEDEKKGEIVPVRSFEEVWGVLVKRHLPEHIYCNHLSGEKAEKDFENKYRGLAKRMYDECFGSGKAVFDTDKYSCGLFGVAEKAVLGIMNQVLNDFSKKEGIDCFTGESKFIHDYAFVAKEIFCEACPSSGSCGDYQTYLNSNGWKKYTPETIAVAGE